MTIKVFCFGVIAEVVGEAVLIVEDVSSIEELLEQLHSRFPKLKEYTFQISVNREIVKIGTKLNDTSEVALLPPFSGG